MQRPSYLVHPSMKMAKLSTNEPAKLAPNEKQPNAKATNQKTQQHDGIRKFPRPVISQKESMETNLHQSDTNFEEPPNIFYDYTVNETGNATSRHARASFYNVPDNTSNFSKSKINFSIVYTPLADNAEGDTEVPYTDKRESFILRCERCGTFVNPFFNFKDGGSTYRCNMCDFEGKMPNELKNTQAQGSGDFPENYNAVYDFVVPDNYKLIDIQSHNILFCFDMSAHSLSNGSFFHVLSSISNLLEYLEADVNVGFVAYDSLVTFFSVDDEDNEVCLSRCIDPENPISPLGFVDLFLNVKSARDKIDVLIQYLQDLGEKQYSEHHLELKNSCHDLNMLGKTLTDVFANRGGRAIIFSSIHKTHPTSTVKYEDKSKTKTLKAKVPDFENLGTTLADKSVTVDMFITPATDMELATIAPLSRLTGGNIYFYPSFDISVESDKVYYDLYRNLTVTRGFDVACRLRTSQGIQILNYHTPKGKVHTLDFRLPSLSSDQNILADMQLGSNLTNISHVYFQFVTLYTNSYNTRLIRLINLRLKVTDDMSVFYKTIDCHAFSYSFIRNETEQLLHKDSKSTNEDLMKRIIKLFRYYRYEVGGRYQAREFALPDRLKFFPLYLSTVLAKQCYNTKVVLSQDHTYSTFLNLTQMTFERLFFYLYPKIYDIGKIYKEWQENLDEYEVGAEIEGVTILPDSIPANINVLKQDSIYLIDNGEYLYLYVRSYTDPELLNAFLGVDDLSQIETPFELPVIDESEFNLRIHAVINRIRATKNNGVVQPIVFVAENDSLVSRLRTAFIEDNGNFFANNYWEFLSQLHERVKDD